jgi:hypothetical protein
MFEMKTSTTISQSKRPARSTRKLKCGDYRDVQWRVNNGKRVSFLLKRIGQEDASGVERMATPLFPSALTFHDRDVTVYRKIGKAFD